MPGSILVVDDERANRVLLEEMLVACGYNVSAASDGQEALEEVARHHPDLVLLDIMMPRLDGLEVCRRLKSDPATRLTPVVLVSSMANLQDRLRGIEAGADDFLNKPVEWSELRARVRSLMKLKGFTDELEHAETVLITLAKSIEAQDPYAAGHGERVALYAERFGKRLGLPEDQILALRRAGLIHDLGKVAVSGTILTNPGPLTPEERILVECHPVVGERICAPLKSLRSLLPIIRHHHEKFDGTGYPDGLSGEAIPFAARVLQAADIFDALSTARSYRGALSDSAAVEIMVREARQGWRDPHLFAEFGRMVGCGELIGQR
jgi:putative two-component system response regulator